MFFLSRRAELNEIFFSYVRPTDELRQQQINQVLVTLKQAYNRYSNRDIPENIFDILFNHTLIASSNTPLNNKQVKEEKNEIHKRLWEIIQANQNEKKSSVKEWIPGSVQYPA